jgi:hypothetical protein
VLGVVEGEHRRLAPQAQADEVRPFVTQVVADQDLVVGRDGPRDDPEDRVSVELFQTGGERGLLAHRAGKRRFGPQIAEERLVTGGESIVAVEGTGKVGEGRVVSSGPARAGSKWPTIGPGRSTPGHAGRGPVRLLAPRP